jgi:CPA2 family monovalent cation:H+ antiporter-2
VANGWAQAQRFGHWLPGALVLGLALSVASTVVLLKALERQGALETPNGRIAVGWLVVEDLAMVLVLVLLPALGSLLGTDARVAPQDLWATLAVTLLKVTGFVALMLVVGRRACPGCCGR